MTSILSFSQNYYPKKILLNKDTCVIIKASQLKEVNIRLVNYSYLKERFYITEKSLEETLSLSLKKDILISDYKGQIIFNDSIYKKLEEKDLQNKKENAILQTDLKQSKKNVRKAGIAGFGLGVLLVLLIL